MSARDLNVIFGELTMAFEEVERQERKAYSDAIDIEDSVLSKATYEKTYAKIHQIKGWIKTLSDLKEEISQSGVFFSPVTPPKKTSGNDAPQAVFQSGGDEIGGGARTNDIPSPEVEAVGESAFFALEEPPVVPSASLANLQPATITVFGKSYSVKGWEDVLVKVCEIMILKKPHIMATLDKNVDLTPSSSSNPKFSYEEGRMGSKKKRLSNGLWMDTTYDANVGVLLGRLLSLCGFDPNELAIA
jgi:hypothetical protein